MNDEIIQALLAIALAVFSGGVGILTIYLKKKWSTDQFQKALGIVDATVRAAEIMGAALGWDAEAKKAYALRRASELSGISETDLATFVEAAVARLKSAGEELTKRGANVIPKT